MKKGEERVWYRAFFLTLAFFANILTTFTEIEQWKKEEKKNRFSSDDVSCLAFPFPDGQFIRQRERGRGLFLVKKFYCAAARN